jgi:hypothetical protein
VIINVIQVIINVKPDIIIKLTFTLNMPQKTQSGSRSTALLVLKLSPRLGWVGKTTPRPLYSQGTTPVIPIKRLMYLEVNITQRECVHF